MLVYVASPYTHSDRRVRRKRAQAVIHLTVQLIQQFPNIHFFSPIAHSHALAEVGDLPCEFEYWEEFDRRVLSACDELWVAMLEGWKQSKGIKSEIFIMNELMRKVSYINPDPVFIRSTPGE